MVQAKFHLDLFVKDFFVLLFIFCTPPMPICTFKVFDPSANAGMSTVDLLIASSSEYERSFPSLRPLLPLYPEPPDGVHVIVSAALPERGTAVPVGIGGLGKATVGGKVLCDITW